MYRTVDSFTPNSFPTLEASIPAALSAEQWSLSSFSSHVSQFHSLSVRFTQLSFGSRISGNVPNSRNERGLAATWRGACMACVGSSCEKLAKRLRAQLGSENLRVMKANGEFTSMERRLCVSSCFLVSDSLHCVYSYFLSMAKQTICNSVLRCVIPVVCLNYKEEYISVKNTTIIWLKWWYL